MDIVSPHVRELLRDPAMQDAIRQIVDAGRTSVTVVVNGKAVTLRKVEV